MKEIKFNLPYAMMNVTMITMTQNTVAIKSNNPEKKKKKKTLWNVTIDIGQKIKMCDRREHMIKKIVTSKDFTAATWETTMLPDSASEK